jgi:ubiquinone/menaquinone biosynthesis C-methylase UbiE
VTQRDHVPALGFDALTRFYDPLLSFTLSERKLKTRLIEQAGVAAGHDVLDVGCGTGTLALLTKQLVPGARVTGLDGDPGVLAIARRKLERAGAEVTLIEGLANESPVFPAASFDRVLTSLVLHHLTHAQRRSALAAMRRWLRTGGELHVLDFGPQDALAMKAISRVVGWFDGAERLADNWGGRLPALIRDAGFADVEERGRALTPFGSVSFYTATARA